MNRALFTVIEDEAIVLFGYQMLIEDWGYSVVAAKSTEEALRALEAEGRAPDAIISDYRLGDGKNGVDAIRSLWARFGQPIPAVIVTGDPDAAHMHAAGIAVPVLAKPIKGDMLQNFLRRCFSGQNPTDTD